MGLFSDSPILPLKKNLKGKLMPIYEYKCSCGKQFETIQGMKEEKLVKCNPNIHDCKEEGKLTRLISSPMIISDDIGRGSKRMTDEHLRKELDID